MMFQRDFFCLGNTALKIPALVLFVQKLSNKLKTLQLFDAMIASRV